MFIVIAQESSILRTYLTLFKTWLLVINLLWFLCVVPVEIILFLYVEDARSVKENISGLGNSYYSLWISTWVMNDKTPRFKTPLPPRVYLLMYQLTYIGLRGHPWLYRMNIFTHFIKIVRVVCTYVENTVQFGGSRKLFRGHSRSIAPNFQSIQPYSSLRLWWTAGACHVYGTRGFFRSHGKGSLHSL